MAGIRKRVAAAAWVRVRVSDVKDVGIRVVFHTHEWSRVTGHRFWAIPFL